MKLVEPRQAEWVDGFWVQEWSQEEVAVGLEMGCDFGVVGYWMKW